MSDEHFDFFQKKVELKEILSKHCPNSQHYHVLVDNINLLSIKIYAECRRSGALEELSKKSKYEVVLQGYHGFAEGHQPIIEFHRTKSSNSVS